MHRAVKYVGVIITDANLIIRAWDQWLVEATGLTEDRVIGQPLLGMFPEIEQRGIAARLKRVLEDGVVEILAPAFHQYFIRCPTQGALPHFDAMQQHVSISPKRETNGIGGLVITIEDVTARRVRERELVAQLKSQDENIRLRAARILSEDAENAAPLLGSFDDESWQVRQAAVRGVSQSTDEEVLARLVETVRDHHADIGGLNAALSALTSSALDPLPHLLLLLSDEHAEVRTYTALAIGNLRDARATEAMLPLLDDPDTNVRFHAIEALGRIGSRAALLPLLSIAESRDPYLGFASLEALAEIGEASAAPAIERLLDDADLATGAAAALAALGDERSAAAVAAALQAGRITPVAAAETLTAIYNRFEEMYGAGDLVADMACPELSPEIVAQLARAIQHASDRTLVALATVIGWLPFEGVDAALAGLLQHDGARRVAIESLVSRGTRSTQVLVQELAAEDAGVRRSAALALGRIGDSRAVEALIAMLDDEEPATIITVAGALGAIGSRAAFSALFDALGHENAAVRHAVVSAINSIGHPDTERRVPELIGSANERLRESGARIAGYFGYVSCLDGIIALMSDESVNVRRTVAEHLAFFDDDRALSALSYALADDNPAVRAAASRGLSHAEHAGTESLLARALADADAHVRYQAVQGIAAHRFTSFSTELQNAAQGDPAIPVRIAAVHALGILRDDAATALLVRLTRHEETDLACAALSALGEMPGPEARTTLERALELEDPRLQLAALDALDALAKGNAESLLTALYRVGSTSANADVAERAISIMARHADDAAVDSLIELTASRERRPLVINALSGLGEDRVSRIARGLAHASADVRLATVETLARMKRSAASRALGTALGDTDPIVRFATEQALSRLDLVEGARPL